MANHLKTELVVDALDMALAQRRPESVIQHSHRGCQYTNYAFGKRCREAGVLPSSARPDAYHNAMAESFFAILDREALSLRRFRSQPRPHGQLPVARRLVQSASLPLGTRLLVTDQLREEGAV